MKQIIGEYTFSVFLLKTFGNILMSNSYYKPVAYSYAYTSILDVYYYL